MLHPAAAAWGLLAIIAIYFTLTYKPKENRMTTISGYTMIDYIAKTKTIHVNRCKYSGTRQIHHIYMQHTPTATSLNRIRRILNNRQRHVERRLRVYVTSWGWWAMQDHRQKEGPCPES